MRASAKSPFLFVLNKFIISSLATFLLNSLDISDDEITVGVFGDDLQDKDGVLKQIPCSKILAHSSIDTNNLNPNILSKLATDMVENLQPNKILISKTNLGQDLGPRLAFKFGWGLVNDCLGIEKNENNDWTGIRPVFGGNFMSKITYLTHDNQTYTVDVQNGLTVMEGAVQNDIPGIDADCGGGMACATCHVYVKEEWLDKLPTKEDGEEDMLDMAFEPKKNSRLSCQLTITDELDGLIVNIPSQQG